MYDDLRSVDDRQLAADLQRRRRYSGDFKIYYKFVFFPFSTI